MPATVTLSTTTLSQVVSAGDGQIKVASTIGMLPGLRLFIDRELMTIISLGIDPWVNVQRGKDGTSASIHDGGATIYIGRADQFYDLDPRGAPPLSIDVSPYINVRDGRVFFAQGDATNPPLRWWQQQTTTYSPGALGIVTATVSPTSST